MLKIEHLALSYLLPTGKELPALQDFKGKCWVWSESLAVARPPYAMC